MIQTPSLSYEKRLEKQNEELRKKLSEASLNSERYMYCEDVIRNRLKDVNKKILELSNTSDTGLIQYGKQLEKIYNNERSYLLKLLSDLEKMNWYGE